MSHRWVPLLSFDTRAECPTVRVRRMVSPRKPVDPGVKPAVGDRIEVKMQDCNHPDVQLQQCLHMRLGEQGVGVGGWGVGHHARGWWSPA